MKHRLMTLGARPLISILSSLWLLISVLFFASGSSYTQTPKRIELRKTKAIVSGIVNSPQRRVENLKAFARIYGYVRFFHPNPKTVDFDWKNFLIYGISRTKDARDEKDLEAALYSLFNPIVSALSVSTKPQQSRKINLQAKEEEIIFWQHLGFGQGENVASDEKSLRVVLPVGEKDFRYLKDCRSDSISDVKEYNLEDLFKDVEETAKPQPAQLFSERLRGDEQVPVEIAKGRWMQIPLALKKKDIFSRSENQEIDFRTLVQSMNSFISFRENIAVEDTFLADIILTWNVFQHFYPYWSEVKIDWIKSLETALVSVNKNMTTADVRNVLHQLLLPFQDGHIMVNPPPVERRDKSAVSGKLPFVVNTVNNKIFVTASRNELIKTGDEIISIDGEAANKRLERLTGRFFGTDRHRTELARVIGFANMSGASSIVKIKRENQISEPSIPNKMSFQEYNQMAQNEYNHKAIEKIDEQTFYINLSLAAMYELESRMPELVKAKRIVFDLRGYPAQNFLIFGHLSDKPVKGPVIGAGKFILPDNVCTKFDWSQLYINPRTPKINAKISVLISSASISRAETYAATFESLGATLVGQTTAGTNGGINWFTTASGFQITYTSSRALKPNHKPQQITGIVSTIKVVKTEKGLKNGDDEELKAALESN